MVNQIFYDYESFKGPISGKSRGALASLEDGDTTGYAMEAQSVLGLRLAEYFLKR